MSKHVWAILLVVFAILNLLSAAWNLHGEPNAAGIVVGIFNIAVMGFLAIVLGRMFAYWSDL